MQIGIIGSGYVGICTGAGFGKLGHNVTLVDIDEIKIKAINKGKSPIFESGVDETIASLVRNNKIRATCNIKDAVQNNDVIFICVGTPCDSEGRINLDFVKAVSKEIGKALTGHKEYPVIVMKCTVVPGTTESLIVPLLEKESGLKAGKDFGIAMNPEFLAEGRALTDFLEPNRIVIGTLDDNTKGILNRLYEKFPCPILNVDTKTAEMIKYASNAALATRISFINEIGNICKTLNIDTYRVSEGIGLDPRIGRAFLNPGIGFGGSCFPKDVKALVVKAQELGCDTNLLDSVLRVNEDQPTKFVDFIESRIGTLVNRKIAVLGLAFKPGTDDIRESPSIKVIKKLLERKADVKAYDPVAEDNARALLGTCVAFADEPEDAVAYGDVVLVLTEWENLKNPALYAGKIVFEGRKVLDASQSNGFTCEGVCW